MICNVFAFPCTVVVREFGNHFKLVKTNPQVLMIVVFLYYCDFRCTSFTLLGMSSTKAWDAGIGVARIFDWGGPKPQITWNDVIRNVRKRSFLWGKGVVEWKI